jgi:hypothetical protein
MHSSGRYDCDASDECSKPARRFSPPWIVEEWEAAFVVKDGVGQKVCVCLFRQPARGG